MTDTLARVLPFYRKALELSLKGHLVRAAEIYGRAAEAARALDPGADNVVVADLLRFKAIELSHYWITSVHMQVTVDAGVLAAHRTEIVTLYSTATAILERRRVAGTLLEGRCSADEEAWVSVVLNGGTSCAPVKKAGVGKLVGYDAFLFAASHILTEVLLNTYVFAEGCPPSQFATFTQFVVHAIELMMLPRHRLTEENYAEALIAKAVSQAVADSNSLGQRGLDPCLVQLLTDAWQRVQQSGVLETRGLLENRLYLKLSAASERRTAANRAALTASGLRSCALAGCAAREAHPQHFKSCAACRAVVYCSREHQLEDWPSHKKACKAARKAAAESSAGGGEDHAAS